MASQSEPKDPVRSFKREIAPGVTIDQSPRGVQITIEDWLYVDFVQQALWGETTNTQAQNLARAIYHAMRMTDPPTKWLKEDQ